jgi:hypothetical protein
MCRTRSWSRSRRRRRPDPHARRRRQRCRSLVPDDGRADTGPGRPLASRPDLPRPEGLLAGDGIPRVVYGRSLISSAGRSANGRCPLRISRAAPNHKLRSAVTALAIGNIGKRGEAVTGGHGGGGHATGGCGDTREKPRSHDPDLVAVTFSSASSLGTSSGVQMIAGLTWRAAEGSRTVPPGTCRGSSG